METGDYFPDPDPEGSHLQKLFWKFFAKSLPSGAISVMCLIICSLNEKHNTTTLFSKQTEWNDDGLPSGAQAGHRPHPYLAPPLVFGYPSKARVTSCDVSMIVVRHASVSSLSPLLPVCVVYIKLVFNARISTQYNKANSIAARQYTDARVHTPSTVI